MTKNMTFSEIKYIFKGEGTEDKGDLRGMWCVNWEQQ